MIHPLSLVGGESDGSVAVVREGRSIVTFIGESVCLYDGGDLIVTGGDNVVGAIQRKVLGNGSLTQSYLEAVTNQVDLRKRRNLLSIWS